MVFLFFETRSLTVYIYVYPYQILVSDVFGCCVPIPKQKSSIISVIYIFVQIYNVIIYAILSKEPLNHKEFIHCWALYRLTLSLFLYVCFSLSHHVCIHITSLLLQGHISQHFICFFLFKIMFSNETKNQQKLVSSFISCVQCWLYGVVIQKKAKRQKRSREADRLRETDINNALHGIIS